MPNKVLCVFLLQGLASHQHFPSLSMLSQCLHWPSAAVSLHTTAENRRFHGFLNKKNAGKERNSISSARVQDTTAAKKSDIILTTE